MIEDDLRLRYNPAVSWRDAGAGPVDFDLREHWRLLFKRHAVSFVFSYNSASQHVAIRPFRLWWISLFLVKRWTIRYLRWLEAIAYDAEKRVKYTPRANVSIQDLENLEIPWLEVPGGKTHRRPYSA